MILREQFSFKLWYVIIKAFTVADFLDTELLYLVIWHIIDNEGIWYYASFLKSQSLDSSFGESFKNIAFLFLVVFF